MTRKEIQSLHEKCAIEDFLKQLYPNHKIIARPNPPDAIASDGDKIIWLEHTDSYKNPKEAKELWIYATTENFSSEKVVISSSKADFGMSSAIIESMLKKLEKESYHPIFEKHGQGILIVSEQDAIYDPKVALPLLKTALEEFYKCGVWRKFKNKEYFSAIYLRHKKPCERPRGLVQIYPSFQEIRAEDQISLLESDSYSLLKLLSHS